jgi:hypothetical protein
MTFFGRGLVVLAVACALAGASLHTAASADDNLTATLRQVIQHSSDEQTQVMDTRNVSLMADTMTDDYFKQLAAQYQSMLDNHVKGVALIKLEWGPMSVAPDGSSAAVTTYESWRIISQEASIDYDPVRNDYALVLDRGTWKIKADVQTLNPPPTPTIDPFATATPTVTPTASPTPTVTPTSTVTPTPTATPAPSDETSPDMTAPDQSVPDQPAEEQTPPEQPPNQQ